MSTRLTKLFDDFASDMTAEQHLQLLVLMILVGANEQALKCWTDHLLNRLLHEPPEGNPEQVSQLVGVFNRDGQLTEVRARFENGEPVFFNQPAADAGRVVDSIYLSGDLGERFHEVRVFADSETGRDVALIMPETLAQESPPPSR